MKKLFTILALGLSVFAAQAANFASVDVENVEDRVTKAKSTVEYFRFGKNVGGFQLDVQARNSRTATGSLGQSLEVGTSTGVGPLFVGAGIGHDFGIRQYNYGYVLGGLSQKVGPVLATGGVKYRTGFDAANPSQTLVFAGVGYPLSKDVSVQAGMTRSFVDIKENAYNVGLRFNY